MTDERRIIEKLISIMPRSDAQLNKPFESDSEILKIDNMNFLVNVDSFSEEDMFVDTNPEILGHNIAVAALSDIYACGGEPLYYAHSLTVNQVFTEEYTRRFYEGIAHVMQSANVSFIGGDFGKGECWQVCATVIGKADRPVLRSGAKIGDAVYMTGHIGKGNVQAAAKLYDISVPNMRFTLRNEEARIIREHATACIDTSDGTFNGIHSICEMSNAGMELYDLPYDEAGINLAELLNMPKELLFFCECGEYELLFTAPANVELPFKRIGTVVEKGIIFNDRDVSQMKMNARSFLDMKDYLKAVAGKCEELL